MFRPKFPEAPALPSTHVISPSVPAVQHGHAPACSCQHTAPAPAPAHRMPGVSAGTVAAVVTVGIVLTALLAAVAVTAISVAVTAVVMRSLLSSHRRR